MKRILFALSVISFVSCFDQSRLKTGLEGKSIPSINLLLIDSVTTINTKALPEGKPTVLFLFTPSCPTCRAQTKNIITNIKSLSNVQFFMVSNFPIDQLKKYYAFYQLNKYPNIIMAQDHNSYFINYFKVTSVPYLAFYNKEKLLKQVLNSKVDADYIKKIVL